MRLGVVLLAIMLAPCATVAPGSAAAVPPATAPMAPTVPMAPRAPSAAATETPVAKQPTLKTCNRQADAKNLTGKERATFVKECQVGRTPPEK